MAAHYPPRFVDPAFEANLRHFDPDLYPRWNAMRLRWEIWRKGMQVMVVQTVDGNYAPLDNRIIQKLFLADTQRYVNEYQFIRNLRLADEHLMTMKRNEQDELMRAIGRDMRTFAVGQKSITIQRGNNATVAAPQPDSQG